jgi:hypothetical protein
MNRGGEDIIRRVAFQIRKSTQRFVDVETVIMHLTEHYPELADEREIIAEIVSQVNSLEEELIKPDQVHKLTEAYKQSKEAKALRLDTEKNGLGERRVIELNSKIKRNGRFTVSPTFSLSRVVDGNDIKSHYYQLIGKKTLEKDQQLMDDIIQYRKQLLQKRITCTLGLAEGNNTFAILKVNQCLIEHGQFMAQFWIGRTVDPSSWPLHVAGFKNVMAAHGVSTVVSLTLVINKTHTVSGISTQFEFA